MEKPIIPLKTKEDRSIKGTLANFITRKTDDGSVVVRGYAALFNSLSEDLGGFFETIAPGFFDNVLGDDVRALQNHDSNKVLGRTLSKTCRIGVDDIGLWFEYDDPETTYSQDLQKSLARADVDQCSFAFAIDYDNAGDKWERRPDGVWIRTLILAKRLYDVSVVTYPAYTDTTVALRGLEEAKKQVTPPPPAYDFARSLDHAILL